jgi:dephospho-CoA kinase
MSNAPFKLGLTGGIGSGKSASARLLASYGATVLDADAIAHALTDQNGLALPHIVKTFGPAVLTAQGSMDRDKMRALVYADAHARQQLEAIIHPLVAQVMAQQAAQAAGAACLVYEIPLLVESKKWRQQLDQVLVIDCTPEVQIQRVMARNQWPREQVEKVLAAQTSRAQRLACADAVVFNNTASLQTLHEHLGQMAHHFGLSSAQPNASASTATPAT